MKFPAGNVAERIGTVGGDAVCTSVIVTSELRFGAKKKGSNRLTVQIDMILEGLAILPLQQPADQAYAELRAHLEQCGHPIGQNDMLIAAHALTIDAVLVTDNEREFARVPGLKVEN